MVWQLNVSPFWIGKFLGQRQTYPMIYNYLLESQAQKHNDLQVKMMADYMFQIYGRK